MAFKADLRKIMLTCFKHNPAAQKFFKTALKYEIDETCPIDDVYDSLIPTLTTKEASRILRKGRDLCWILRKNEDGDLRISLKGSDHVFKQIRLYGNTERGYSRRSEGEKIGLKQLLKSMVDDGTLGEQIKYE